MGDLKDGAVLRLEDSLFDAEVEELEHLVVKAIGIQQDDGFVVEL
jgi:hypothetical protein